MASNKYCEYFDVNESYFPCIDESAINAGAPWETTYPHETCDSVNPQVSHVIQAIGVPNEYAEGTIRVSFGRDNQVEEARDVANAIICILNSKL